MSSTLLRSTTRTTTGWTADLTASLFPPDPAPGRNTCPCIRAIAQERRRQRLWAVVTAAGGPGCAAAQDGPAFRDPQHSEPSVDPGLDRDDQLPSRPGGRLRRDRAERPQRPLHGICPEPSAGYSEYLPSGALCLFNARVAALSVKLFGTDSLWSGSRPRPIPARRSNRPPVGPAKAGCGAPFSSCLPRLEDGGQLLYYVVDFVVGQVRVDRQGDLALELQVRHRQIRRA